MLTYLGRLINEFSSFGGVGGGIRSDYFGFSYRCCSIYFSYVPYEYNLINLTQPLHSITHSLSAPTVTLQSTGHLTLPSSRLPKGYHLGYHLVVLQVLADLKEAERRMVGLYKIITRASPGSTQGGSSVRAGALRAHCNLGNRRPCASGNTILYSCR